MSASRNPVEELDAKTCEKIKEEFRALRTRFAQEIMEKASTISTVPSKEKDPVGYIGRYRENISGLLIESKDDNTTTKNTQKYIATTFGKFDAATTILGELDSRRGDKAIAYIEKIVNNTKDANDNTDVLYANLMQKRESRGVSGWFQKNVSGTIEDIKKLLIQYKKDREAAAKQFLQQMQVAQLAEEKARQKVLGEQEQAKQVALIKDQDIAAKKIPAILEKCNALKTRLKTIEAAVTAADQKQSNKDTQQAVALLSDQIFITDQMISTLTETKSNAEKLDACMKINAALYSPIPEFLYQSELYSIFESEKILDFLYRAPSKSIPLSDIKNAENPLHDTAELLEFTGERLAASAKASCQTFDNYVSSVSDDLLTSWSEIRADRNAQSFSPPSPSQ